MHSASDAHHMDFQKIQSLATNGEVFPWQDIRLPSHTIPIHYDIFLHPNLTTFYMTGSVEILLTILEKTNFFVIHSKDLNISEVSVSNVWGKAIPVNKFLLSKSQEQLKTNLPILLILLLENTP